MKEKKMADMQEPEYKKKNQEEEMWSGKMEKTIRKTGKTFLKSENIPIAQIRWLNNIYMIYYYFFHS